MKNRINYSRIFETFEFEGFKIYIVNLVALACVIHDRKNKIYIDKSFWEKLTEEEKKALIKHEIEELKLINKGLSWWKAHLIATSKDDFEIRKRILWKCHKSNMSKLGIT